MAEKDQDVEKFSEEAVLAWKEKEDGLVDAIINPPPPPEGEEKEDDDAEDAPDLEARALEITKLKLKFQLDLIKENEFLHARFSDLPKRKVVKMHKLFKCIFYFLEFTSESICVEGTQQFFWKKARHHWNAGLIQKMLDYRYIGKKDHALKKYHTINYIEKNLEGMS